MSDIPTKAKLDEYVKLGMVRSQTHPELPLSIYVYTEFTQFERLWNNVTRACRGLVVDNKGRCIVRCLPKFFNEDEPHAVCDRPKETPIHFDKLDGSLIQVVDDEEYGFIVTSKGSFNSDQSNWAKEIIEQNYPASNFYKGYTYVFELIHPENRIVLDYKGEKGLYLLAVIETETGKELDIHTEPFKMFKPAPVIENILEHMKRMDVEGVVVKTGTHRYKVKTGEYLRLHRIVTGFTPKRVWESLKDGQSLEFENMPEEFEHWLDSVIDDLKDKFSKIESEAIKEYEATKHLTDKELGLSQDLKYKGLIFMVRNDRDPKESIWKMIKPKKEVGDEDTTT